MVDRDYEYEKNETEFESQAYLRGLLRTTVLSIDSLGDAESQASGEQQRKFKNNVNKLAKFYYFKFDENDDVERPEELENKELGGPANLSKKNMKEVKKVFFRIQELQKELGHTKLESLQRGNRVI